MWDLALLSSGLALALLPLVPALHEWRRGRDAAPLQVVRRQDTNIRHFAESFARLTAAVLAEHGVDCREPRGTFTAVTPRGEPFSFIDGAGEVQLSTAEARTREIDRLLFCCGRLRLPGEVLYHRGVSAGELVVEPRAICHSLLARGALWLGGESIVARWLHAGGPLHVARDCRLYSRASSDSEMTLERGVRFERLNAPVIRFGHEPSPGPPPFARDRNEWLPPRCGHLDPRTLLTEAEVRMPAGSRLDFNLVSRRRVFVGAGSLVTGSIKARGLLELGEGAVVRGSVVSNGRLHIRAGCAVTGPVIAEREVVIDPGAVIGARGLRTTVTAPRILVAEGARVSGSIWARELARVVPARRRL